MTSVKVGQENYYTFVCKIKKCSRKHTYVVFTYDLCAFGVFEG